MDLSTIILLLVIMAVLAANLPWLYTQRFLFFFSLKDRVKVVWMQFTEWLLLYFMVGLLAFAMEKNVTGVIHEKGWEFYSVCFFLFLVFAFPGIIYRYQFVKYLK